MLQLSIIILKKALKRVTILKLLHVPQPTQEDKILISDDNLIYAKTRSFNFQLQHLVKGAGKIGGKIGNSKCIGNGINKNSMHFCYRDQILLKYHTRCLTSFATI